jgi:hypothetical protein
MLIRDGDGCGEEMQLKREREMKRVGKGEGVKQM